ncbi:MAG: hypothetical protein EA377_05915 [Phycisphaerales bacterium]|nr:MAG: hypothetical protein EA377_05915 [Phycisphaerales bacterium]
MSRLLLAALIGGIIVFIWGSVSYMALPFHAQTLNTFPGERAELEEFFSRVSETGVYMYPGQVDAPEGAAADKREGPTVTMMVLHPQGVDTPMWASLALFLLVNCVGAFILAMMIQGMRRGGAPALACVLVGVLFAVFAIVVAYLPDAFFWHYPRERVTLSVVDILLPWTVVSVVLTIMLKPRPE